MYQWFCWLCISALDLQFNLFTYRLLPYDGLEAVICPTVQRLIDTLDLQPHLEQEDTLLWTVAPWKHFPADIQSIVIEVKGVTKLVHNVGSVWPEVPFCTCQEAFISILSCVNIQLHSCRIVPTGGLDAIVLFVKAYLPTLTPQHASCILVTFKKWLLCNSIYTLVHLGWQYCWLGRKSRLLEWL